MPMKSPGTRTALPGASCNWAANPTFRPATLLQRSHADYDESNDLKTMVRVNLIAERIAVETYRQMIALIGDKDPTTRRMLEDVLADEEEHADELKDWLEK
jgi:bacterioferritin